MKRRITLVLAAVFAWLALLSPPTPARAEPPPPTTAPAAPAVLDPAVAPFVGEAVDLVACVDLSQVRPDQLLAWLDKQVQASPPPAADKAALEKALAGMKGGAADAKAWVDQFVKAGGRRVYVVGSAGALLLGAPPLFVIPVDPGGDPAAVAKLFDPTFGQPAPAIRPDANPAGPVEPSVAAVVGGAVVFGPRTAIDAGKAAKPADRPAFAAALAAGGEGAAVRVAVNGAAVVGPPAAPGAPSGAPAAADPPGGLKDVEWVSLAVRPPPDESISLVVQAKTPEGARAVADTLNGMLTQFGKNPLARAAVGDVGPIIQALRPETTGNRVAIRVGARAIEDVLAPAIIKAAATEARQRDEYRKNNPPTAADGGGAATQPSVR